MGRNRLLYYGGRLSVISMYNNSTIKKFGAGLASVMLLSTLMFAPPQPAKAELTILSILIGGVASLFGVDFFSCGFNIVFYCDEDGTVVGSSGGGGTVVVQDPCTSTANSCGQTNTGFYNEDHSICSADAPPNSTCPAPVIEADDFYADPAIVGINMSSTLYWTSEESTECTLRGGSVNSTVGTSGTMSTGPIAQTTAFTLTCENGDGGPTSSQTVRVVVDPNYREI